MKLGIKNAVAALVIINIFIFILQLVLGDNFTHSFMLVSGDVFIRPWIMLTSMFLHGSFGHLLFNMYVLLMFGSLLEQKIGSKRLVLIYFISGIIASFLSSFFYDSALGASGAIMGVLGVVIILMPDLRVLFFFVVPMKFWVAAIIIALIDVFGIFVPSGIGNIAHLTGMACGLLYGLRLKKEKKIYRKKFSSKTYLNSDDIEEYYRTGRI